MAFCFRKALDKIGNMEHSGRGEHPGTWNNYHIFMRKICEIEIFETGIVSENNRKSHSCTHTFPSD